MSQSIYEVRMIKNGSVVEFTVPVSSQAEAKRVGLAQYPGYTYQGSTKLRG